MSVASNIISAAIKSVVGDKIGNELAKEVIGISIDGVSENGINKINDFISGEKAKIEHILSKENMRSMNIPENAIDHVVEEIKDLFKSIEITDEVLRQCKYESMKLKDFLWDEYCGYKGDNHIEHESEIKRCLFAMAEVLIKLVRESETFQQDVSIHISNSVDDITIGLQKISEYMEDNFDKLDADHQMILDILRMILEQTKNFNIQNSDKEQVKFQNNKKEVYIKNWNSRLFLHQNNDENPITLADAFIMPDFEMYKSIKRIGFSSDDTLDKIIEKFAKYKKTSTMLITGVPGIGKSTITSWLANKYRDDDRYIILRFRDWDSEELDSGLLRIICSTLGCKKKELENKILILDGFDELKSLNIRERLLDDFANDIKDFENIKFIITSRPMYINSMNFDNYFGLCPFDYNQIKMFYQKVTNTKLKGYIDYNNIDVFGIPVILYMAIMSKINITKSTTKPQLYNRIFAEKGGIFDRFYDGEVEYDKGSQIFRNPKNIKEYLKFLRKIAFLMFEKNSLSLMVKDYDIPKLEHRKGFVSILEFPIKHLFENTKSNIEFIHKSIYEFFVSEYIFEAICKVIDMSDDELAKCIGETLESGILSEEIIEFLRYKFKNSVIMMFEFEHFKYIFEKMIEEGMTYCVNRRLKKVIDCEIIIFTNVLHILHFWEFDSLHLNSTLVHYYLYGNKIVYDLSKVSLMRANLRGVDLSKANLRESNLRKTDLRGADLRKADLRNANLSGADLRRADLKGAKLEASIWYESDTRKALSQLKTADFTFLMIREDNGEKRVQRSELFPNENQFKPQQKSVK